MDEKVNEKLNNNAEENDSKISSREDESSSMVLEAVRNEYEHTMQRSEKLDTKVNLLLTVYALLFAFSTSTLDGLSVFKNYGPCIPSCKFGLLLIYIASIIGMYVLYAILLYKIKELLKGVQIKRLDPEKLFNKEYYEGAPKDVAFKISRKYFEALDFNNKVLKGRFDSLNTAKEFLLPILILTIISSIIKYFV